MVIFVYLGTIRILPDLPDRSCCCYNSDQLFSIDSQSPISSGYPTLDLTLGPWNLDLVLSIRLFKSFISFVLLYIFM